MTISDHITKGISLLDDKFQRNEKRRQKIWRFEQIWPLAHLALMETSLHGLLDNLIHIPLSLEKTQYLNNKISTMKMSCQNGDPKRASICLRDREKGRMGWEGVRFVRFVNQYLGILWRGLRSGSLPTDGYWILGAQQAWSKKERKESTSTDRCRLPTCLLWLQIAPST